MEFYTKNDDDDDDDDAHHQRGLMMSLMMNDAHYSFVIFLLFFNYFLKSLMTLPLGLLDPPGWVYIIYEWSLIKNV